MGGRVVNTLPRPMCFLTPGACFLSGLFRPRRRACPGSRTCPGHGSAACAEATAARVRAAAPHGNELFGKRRFTVPAQGRETSPGQGGGVSNSVGGCLLTPLCAVGARGGSCKSAWAITPPVLERPARVAVSHGHPAWPSQRTAVSASGGLGWLAWLVGLAGASRTCRDSTPAGLSMMQ